MDSLQRTRNSRQRCILLFLLSAGFITILYRISSAMSAEKKETFLYFGYGSNMLTERIHINNPTAKYVDWGTLQNYRFGFETILALPKDFGAIATIRKGASKDHVVGTIWEIEAEQVGNLDLQEQFYQAIEVKVETPNGSILKCRTYEMNNVTDPANSKPHPFYKKICVEGAKQHYLPKEYIRFLESFEDTKQPRPDGFYEPLVAVFEKMDREDV